MDASKYQVSSVTGFLSEVEPLGRLPDRFSVWEETLDKLTTLIKTRELRLYVERWPYIQPSASSLPSERHWQRASVVLTFVSQAYIWVLGVKGTPSRLPQALAKPWGEVQKYLGLPPVAAYAPVVLYNWRLVEPRLGITPGNLAILHTYTGSRDEEWFYLVSLFCELAAAPGISAAIEALKAIEQRNSSQLLASLYRVAASIKEMTKTLDRMYEECQPDVFYNAVRPFQSGYADPSMFPNGGIVFEGVSDTPQQFGGASAAQSSTLPVFDTLLGVSKTGGGQDFLMQQRLHMPRPHRDFLSALDIKQLILKSYIAECRDAELTRVYNQCIENLVEFRGQHVIIVTRMIVIPANTCKTNMGVLANKGTGGTDFMSILKNIRDDTASHQLTDSHNSA